MKENLKDILSNLHSEVDQQTLLNYLQGKLSAEQQHEVEKNLLDKDFEAEALEGLQDFSDKTNISALVNQLNIDLKKKTSKKNKWRERRELKIQPWLLIAILLILVLAVISYIIIHKMRGQ
jgi:predicted secreted protein